MTLSRRWIMTAGAAAGVAALAGCTRLGTLNGLNSLTPGDGGVDHLASDIAFGADPRQQLDIYAPTGALGMLAAKVGLKTAYSPLGIFIALVFIGLPFVVRSLQPVLQDLDREVEEAATTLGANAVQRAAMVILPTLAPSLISGVSLAFARAVGEYGSVVFIAGNLPGKTEIAPLLVVIKLEQYDYAGAAAIGLATVAISFGSLILINVAQLFLARRGKA
jgi:sulfate transport system permease protein